MQCPNCKFENMPGQVKCFQCGCVLEATEPVQAYPPRMGIWRKPFRQCGIFLRRTGMVKTAMIPEWLEFVSFNCLAACVESLIPGGAHILQKRLSKIWWMIILWVVCLAAGIFLLGSQWGALLLWSALAIHAYIIIDSMLLDLQILKKLIYNILAAGVLYVLYVSIVWNTILGLSGIYANHDISSAGIKTGEYLLVKRIESEQLKRGDIVCVPTTINRRGFLGERSRYAGDTIAQIVGLPGEVVKLEKGEFYVDGKPLGTDDYKPMTFQNKSKFEIKLGDSQYFVNLYYIVNEQTPTNSIIQVSRFDVEDIQGRALAKWEPFDKEFILGD